MSGIVKRFGGITALDGASLEVCAGEVHALVGENGAGKSTLINIATGIHRPDAGALLFAGAPAALATPRDAAALGIAVVHQEADLFPQLSLAENMLLGRGLVCNSFGLVQWNRVYADAYRDVQAMGEPLDVRLPASGLSVARRMMAEIAAAVSEKAQVLFLDEPTASLTIKEIEHLFTQIRRLRDAGVGIVYVSHRLEEVLDISDRVTIMRDGKTVGTHPTGELTMGSIVANMVGRNVEVIARKPSQKIGDVRLNVSGATDTHGAFRDISLEVRAGEILGLYGFVGAGRSEFGQALFGLRRLAAGSVKLDGRTLSSSSPGQAVLDGIAYLPEDRLVQGVFRSHSVRTNSSIAMLRRLSRFTMISGRKERSLAQTVLTDMRVRTQSMEQTIVTLSGGNQQKVVFGRWQATGPKVLILDEPTRGVDVGAKAEIHRLIRREAEHGSAVLLISSELPEIMSMSDRVITLSEGRQTGYYNPEQDSQATIAQAAVPRMENGAEVTTRREPHPLRRALQMRELGLFLFIVLLAGGMSLYRPDEFLTVNNFFDVLARAALPAIMAQGAMLIICAGGIDISVGSMMGLTGAIAALAAKTGAPPLACLAIAMGAGCLLSMANGSVALSARIHPIIVTLAGISIYRGLMRWVTGAREVYQLPDSYRALAHGDLLGIPKICYYAIAVTILVHVLLRYTLTGRRVLALGNSESAARLIGLSKVRLTLFVFAVSGALVGLTAVLHAGFYGKVQANTGEGWELMAIAAAVIGGTNILGGRGSAIGTLLGAFLVALVPNILNLAVISPYWQGCFMGALILAAVVADLGLRRVWRAES
jgi:ABC-type sugar transport system ATPase subunit/ribose/xylose/arabinose/galactoside ABC-type transport system permease subunit